MTRKFLENLGLEKEVIDKILTENSADVDAVTKERDALNTQIAERDKQLETLKKASGDNENLKKQIADLQENNKKQAESHAAELKQLRIDNAVDKALTASKAKNNTAVRALLKDLDKAELNDDGSVKGLQKQIDSLINDESTSFLFDTAPPQFKGFQPQNGDTPGVDFNSMTYSQMNAYLETHPNAKID